MDLRVLTPSHFSGMDRIDLRVLTLRISAEWIIILMPAPMVPWYLFCGMDRIDLRVLTPSHISGMDRIDLRVLMPSHICGICAV